MAISIIFTKIKALCLFFVNLFRRALCCFRRRRRPSNDSVPLTHVGVISPEDTGCDTQAWTEWTNKPETFEDYKAKAIQDQIEMYRKQKIIARQKRDEDSAVEQQNFFDDMAPRITRQKKVFLNTDSESSGNQTRLTMDADGLNLNGDELGEWEENSGWENETLDWAAREALMEKKRQQREQRIREQQQKRMERSNRPVALGARLS